MAVDRARAEAGLSELLTLYRDAQRIIAMQVKEAIEDQRIARRAFRIQAFRQVEAELARLGAESEPLSRRLIENAWREGDESVTRILTRDGRKVNFGQINHDALTELQQALGTSLADARQTVGRRVFDVCRRAGLQSTALGLLGARGSGRAISQDLAERLSKQGIKSFTDRAGRQWDMKTYTEMVARTTTREAVVAAQISRMSEQGIELARVNNNGSKCAICGPWEGQLVSLSGAISQHMGEPVTTLGDLPNGGPPFHPNCRHFLEPQATDFQRFIDEQGGKGGAPPPSTRPPADAKMLESMEGGHGNTRARVNREANIVEKLHNPDVTLNVKTGARLQKGTPARYLYDGSQTIEIDANGLRPSIFTHEVAHAIEEQRFGASMGMHFDEGLGHEALSGLWDAVVAAKTRQRLESAAVVEADRTYLMQPFEIFARAYQQWVIIRAGNREMRRHLGRMRRSDRAFDRAWFWGDDEFKGIARELDKLFGIG